MFVVGGGTSEVKGFSSVDSAGGYELGNRTASRRGHLDQRGSDLNKEN